MRRRLPHLLALGLVALAVLPAPAGAATFGADLSQPVSTTATCANSFFASSCLGYAVTPTSYAPASGVVSAVRVKTGDAPQGPMQVVVLRSYYQNNLQDPGHPNFFCCFLQEYGPTFTPARNAVTTVPVTLGMVEDPTPGPNDGNTVAKGDFLGLSVLAGDAPIPVAAVAAAKPRKPKRLGSARFAIAAGKKKTVKVKLNAAGRRLARHRRRVTVYAVATVGVQVVTTKVTLEAPRS